MPIARCSTATMRSPGVIVIDQPSGICWGDASPFALSAVMAMSAKSPSPSSESILDVSILKSHEFLPVLV